MPDIYIISKLAVNLFNIYLKTGHLNVGLSPSEIAAHELKKAKYPKPDTTQMLPFKPVRNACKFIFPSLY